MSKKSYVIDCWEPPSIAVSDVATRFPVRRIFCVGRNYAEHAREMGSDPRRERPCFFSKPATAVVPGGEVRYPPATKNLHHEVELVVAMARGGAAIEVADALNCVFGYTVGLDLTRRDLQTAAKNAGQPWDMAKGFDESAPVGELVSAASGHPTAGRIWLRVNGELRQQGDLEDMIYGVAEIISHLSSLLTLLPGDLIFTGTPAGVSAIKSGDHLTCGIDGIGNLEVTIV